MSGETISLPESVGSVCGVLDSGNRRFWLGRGSNRARSGFASRMPSPVLLCLRKPEYVEGNEVVNREASRKRCARSWEKHLCWKAKFNAGIAYRGLWCGPLRHFSDAMVKPRVVRIRVGGAHMGFGYGEAALAAIVEFPNYKSQRHAGGRRYPDRGPG
jgi:hypothetical protein